MMILKNEEKARGADSTRLACLSFVSGLFYTEVSYDVLWKGNGLISFSRNRNVKSSGDIRVVLCDIVSIDRLIIKGLNLLENNWGD